MAITDRKITAWTNPIVNEADRPQRTASEMKAVFDSNANQLRVALNGLIDDLGKEAAADELGITAPKGYEGTTVQAVINNIADHASIVKTEEQEIRFLNGKGEYTVPAVGAAANGTPMGGTEGQVLLKDGTEDYKAKWATMYGLPVGGTDGQMLVKSGGADGTAEWKTYALWFYATIPAAGWNAEKPYTQTVAIEGILGSDKPKIDIVPTEETDPDLEIIKAWSRVSYIKTEDGAITVICLDSLPEIDIPIQMEVIR